jgi:Cu(I)/Ag(I) efflux system membrane fusion protein
MWEEMNDDPYDYPHGATGRSVMRVKDRFGAVLRGFSLSGSRGVIILAAVAIVSFLVGGLFLSRGGPETGHERVANEAVEEGPGVEIIWTCSMHPQIRLPKPGKCPICAMDLIPANSGMDEDEGPRELRMTETAKQLAQIQTTRVRRGFAEAEVRMVGKVSYDESEVAYITAWVPGRLDRLYADYTGVVVNKGDHMVSMYSPELLAAQEELVQAGIAVNALREASSRILRSTAEATVDAAREKLRLVGLTPGQIDTIERTGKTSDHLTIYAPAGGVIVHKDATEGMYVTTGTRIYTIADLSKLWVVFEAYESDLPWLRFGQRVQFTSPAFPGEQFEAAVSFIDPLVDPETRTVRVRAVVENPDKRLKPDMFVRGVVTSRLADGGNILDEALADKWISPMHPEVIKDGPGTCDVCGMDLVPMASLGYVSAAATEQDAPLLIPASATGSPSGGFLHREIGN